MEKSVSIIEQMQAVRKYKFAAFWSLIVAAMVPVAVYFLSHSEQIKTNPKLWYLVYAGLTWSGFTVCSAMYRMTDGGKFYRSIKAIAFPILLEGAMSFVDNYYLTGAILFILITINALDFSYTIVSRYLDQQKAKQTEIDNAVNDALDNYKAELAEARKERSERRKATAKPRKKATKRGKVSTVVAVSEFENDAELMASLS